MCTTEASYRENMLRKASYLFTRPSQLESSNTVNINVSTSCVSFSDTKVSKNCRCKPLNGIEILVDTWGSPDLDNIPVRNIGECFGLFQQRRYIRQKVSTTRVLFPALRNVLSLSLSLSLSVCVCVCVSVILVMTF